MKIKQQLIRDTKHKYGKSNKKKYITVHQTDNWDRGANAQVHANLQSRVNPRKASWHWQVDDIQAIQSFLHYFQLWHCSDGRGNGNLNSIGVELCLNRDGNYNKAVENGAELVAYIMKKENIQLSNVVQHNYWSGKNCPSQIRRGKNGISWSDFKKLVAKKLNKGLVESTKTIEKLIAETLAGKYGNGAERRRLLGSNYNEVQREIDKMYNSKFIPKPTKTIDKLVEETLLGFHGNGAERKKSLGSNYQKVQQIINGKFERVDINKLVQEALAGKHGNGAQRKKSLGKHYNEVQNIINKKYSGKSIDTLVKETLEGKHGNGAERRKSLGTHYKEVQSIINKRYK